MTILALVLTTVVLVALSLLCWSRVQQVNERPYGTGLQRAASFFLALALLCAGFADRAYHQQLPDAFTSGTISKATPHHTKNPFPQDYATIQIRQFSGELLTLSLASCIRCLHPGQSIRVTYDPVSMFIRTAVVLAPAQFDTATIDSRAANGRRLNPWMWASIFLSYTALPFRARRQQLNRKASTTPDRSDSLYGAGG
jgi:hypothetical protein